MLLESSEVRMESVPHDAAIRIVTFDDFLSPHM
jgi:hypothetical protein